MLRLNAFCLLEPDSPDYLFLTASYTYGDYEFDVLVPQPENNFHTNNLTAQGGFWMFGLGYYLATTERTSLRFMATYAPLKVRRPPDFEKSTDALLNFRVTFNYRL